MSFHTSLLFWFQIWKTWIADGVCGCSGPFWIWTLACNKPVSTKTTWSTETEAALFRLSLWDRCSHEEWDWMRMWGAFAVDGPLTEVCMEIHSHCWMCAEYSMLFLASVREKMCWNKGCPIGRASVGRQKARIHVPIFPDLKHQLGCGSLLFCRVLLQTFLGAPWNCHWTAQNESKRRGPAVDSFLKPVFSQSFFQCLLA